MLKLNGQCVYCLYTAAMERYLSSSAPSPSSNKDYGSYVPSPLAIRILCSRQMPRTETGNDR